MRYVHSLMPGMPNSRPIGLNPTATSVLPTRLGRILGDKLPTADRVLHESLSWGCSRGRGLDTSSDQPEGPSEYKREPVRGLSAHKILRHKALFTSSYRCCLILSAADDTSALPGMKVFYAFSTCFANIWLARNKMQVMPKSGNITVLSP